MPYFYLMGAILVLVLIPLGIGLFYRYVLLCVFDIMFPKNDNKNVYIDRSTTYNIQQNLFLDDDKTSRTVKDKPHIRDR